MKTIIPLIASLALMATTTQADAKKERDSWYIGFGLGSGIAEFTVDDRSRSWTEIFEDTDSIRLAINFQAGTTINDRLLLGLDISAMRQQFSEGGITVGLQHNQYLAAATFFPTGKGLFLRGGAGAAVIIYEVNDSFASLTAREGGLGAMAGVGFAFWVGESFNLTLSNDFHYADFGEADDGSTLSNWFNTINLGFMWY